MIVSVVSVDNAVSVDGKLLNFNFNVDPNIWAIQWNGESGHVEYKDGTQNADLTSFAEFQYLVDAFFAEEARLDAEAQQAEADRIASMTYFEKRQEAYPPVEYQLDMLFHDMKEGTTTWVDKIQSVKNQFPK